MTLTMGLRWRNPDSSTDINLRLKDVAEKGFVSGGNLVPVPGFAQIDVEPFVCITYDGAVVRSDVTERVNVGVGLHYIVLRARYVLLGSPVLQLNAIPAASFPLDPEFDWLHVIGTTARVGADVQPNEISYSERDVVDPQARSFWREPMPTFAALTALEPSLNRHGDVRLTLDTGSLWWWNDTVTTWEIFDEVPLMSHRLHEHTNGITGDSDPTTLENTVVSPQVTVTLPPAGSGYVCNGRYGTAAVGSGPNWPAPQTLDLSLGGFAARGLVQVYLDQMGVLDADYRLSLVGLNLLPQVRIVGISDSHPAGGPLLLEAEVGPDRLRWDGGPWVEVTVGQRARLYRDSGTDWIEVVTTAGTAITQDQYTVFASRKVDDYLLLSHVFWDTAAAVLGEDKRYFGNLAKQDLVDDLKVEQIEPWDDLRGNMVFSGGAVTFSPAPPNGANHVAVSVPLVAYIRGQRYVVDVPSGTTGVGPFAAGTSQLYVDSDGVFQVAASLPSSGDYATIAEVTSNGAAITGAVDARDPQLVVGMATRDARVRFTPEASARWHEADSRLVVEDGGSTTGVSLETGSARLSDGLVDALGSVLTFSDANTPSPQALSSSTYNDLSVLQPLEAAPSLIGALAEGQLAVRFGPGVVTGCALSFVGASAQVNPGSFVDAAGRFITNAGLLSTTIAGVAGSYVVFFGDGALQNVLLSTGCTWRKDLPFAVAVFDGVNITSLFDISPKAAGTMDDAFTVGGSGNAHFAQFNSALAFRAAFSDVSTAPKVFRVVSNVNATNTNLVSLAAAPFPGSNSCRARLGGMVISGNYDPSSSSPVTVTWGQAGVGSTAPLFAFNQFLVGVTFENIRFSYAGIANGDVNNNWITGPGASFNCRRVIWAKSGAAGDGVTAICRVTSSAFGGGSSTFPPTVFDGCVLNNAVGTGGRFISSDSSMVGQAVWRDCTLTQTDANVLELFNTTAVSMSARLKFDGCTVTWRNPTTSLFGYTSPVDGHGVDVIGGTVATVTGTTLAIGGGDTQVNITGATLGRSAAAGTVVLTSVFSAVGVRSDTAQVWGGTDLVLSEADFLTSGSFGGTFKKIANSQIDVNDGPFGTVLFTTDQIQTISSTYLQRRDAAAVSTPTTILNHVEGSLKLDSVVMTYAGAASGAVNAMVNLGNAATRRKFEAVGCTFDTLDRNCFALRDIDSLSTNFRGSVSRCTIRSTQRAAFLVQTAVAGEAGAVGWSIDDCDLYLGPDVSSSNPCVLFTGNAIGNGLGDLSLTNLRLFLEPGVYAGNTTVIRTRGVTEMRVQGVSVILPETASAASEEYRFAFGTEVASTRQAALTVRDFVMRRKGMAGGHSIAADLVTSGYTRTSIHGTQISSAYTAGAGDANSVLAINVFPPTTATALPASVSLLDNEISFYATTVSGSLNTYITVAGDVSSNIRRGNLVVSDNSVRATALSGSGFLLAVIDVAAASVLGGLELQAMIDSNLVEATYDALAGLDSAMAILDAGTARCIGTNNRVVARASTPTFNITPTPFHVVGVNSSASI